MDIVLVVAGNALDLWDGMGEAIAWEFTEPLGSRMFSRIGSGERAVLGKTPMFLMVLQGPDRLDQESSKLRTIILSLQLVERKGHVRRRTLLCTHSF